MPSCEDTHQLLTFSTQPVGALLMLGVFLPQVPHGMLFHGAHRAPTWEPIAVLQVATMQALPTLTECHHFLRRDAPSAVLSSVHCAMPITNATTPMK